MEKWTAMMTMMMEICKKCWQIHRKGLRREGSRMRSAAKLLQLFDPVYYS